MNEQEEDEGIEGKNMKMVPLRGLYLPGVGGETVISVTDSCLVPMVSLVRSAAFAAPDFLLGQVDVDEGSVR